MTEMSTKAGPAVGSAFVVPGELRDGVALWLVRHGETEWSKAGRHTGRTDLPLTPDGERQARALPALLGDTASAFVLCSPLRRARATAELAGLHVDAVDDDLAEWDYGDYEGRTGKQIRAEVPGWALFEHGVPNGETIEQVCARADRVLGRAVKHLADGPVVLVAHGHISRVIGARWLGLPPQDGQRLLLGTAAPSLLSVQYGIAAVERWNIPNPAAHPETR